MIGVITASLDLSYQHKGKELTIPFHIWDINGSQRYFHFLDSYCSNVDCCVLAFDVAGSVSVINAEFRRTKLWKGETGRFG